MPVTSDVTILAHRDIVYSTKLASCQLSGTAYTFLLITQINDLINYLHRESH